MSDALGAIHTGSDIRTPLRPQFAVNRNSAISGGTDASDGYYDVDYTWEKAVAGRNTIRKTTMVMPEGSTLTYEYLSTSSLHDADASRVTRVKVSTTAVASYAYNGVGQLVGTSLPQPDVFMTLYDPADLDDYDRLDNFGRVTQCKWTKDLGTDRDFYHTSITWDRNGNVTLIEDNVHSGFDVAYTNDNVNRLTKAEEGTWNGSSITSRTREQNWTLDQVGNWEIAKLDLDGDNNWNETGEYNDDRTHNVVNELTARDTDDNGTDNYTLTYDGVGNLTDDGNEYEYVYDVWGRLRKVLNTSTQALIEEFWYNGLGFRITFHADATGNGTTDGSDPKYHLIYDERWRLVATYRADDDNPKEAFVPHQAGLDGTGSSSYIDSVILRQRDANSGWVNAADGTMEERRNFCQNWRSDVSALLTSAGVMVEWGKFTAYGRGPQSRFFGIGVPLPIGLPAGDIDSDFITDTGDVDAIQTWVAAYDVRADLDLDGDIDATDGTLAEGYEGWQLGWNVLSHEDVANRLGYAGYHKDVNLDISHVRNRVLDPHLGRWTRRDPLGYVDGMGLYEYMTSNSMKGTDPLGLWCPPLDPTEFHREREGLEHPWEWVPIVLPGNLDLPPGYQWCKRKLGDGVFMYPDSQRPPCLANNWGICNALTYVFKPADDIKILECIRRAKDADDHWPGANPNDPSKTLPFSPADAMRHCVLACCLREQIGMALAHWLLAWHEFCNVRDGLQKKNSEFDSYNNAVGSECVHRSQGSCENCCACNRCINDLFKPGGTVPRWQKEWAEMCPFVQ